MIRLVFHLTASLYYWVHHHMPVNRLVVAARTQPDWRWAPVALLVSLACFLASASLTVAIDEGASGWLNLIVIVLLIDAIKTLLLVPASLAWAARRAMARSRLSSAAMD